MSNDLYDLISSQVDSNFSNYIDEYCQLAKRIFRLGYETLAGRMTEDCFTSLAVTEIVWVIDTFIDNISPDDIACEVTDDHIRIEFPEYFAFIIKKKGSRLRCECESLRPLERNALVLDIPWPDDDDPYCIGE
jgi:hypothetical protein